MLNFLENFYRKKELASFGVYLNDVHSEKAGHRLSICLLRGFMVFLACFGTIIGTIDAFELPYNRNTVFLFIFLISFFMAFLYINKYFFYVGYFALLFLFTRFLVQFYLVANSGYQAIMNEIYLAYSDYFKLSSVRQAQEFYTDRNMTITVALFFIAVFLAMLLNVTISGYMNLAETVLITFPFIELAFYINKRPPLYCIIMLLAVYISVGILQASRYARMQVKGRKSKEYVRIRTKKKTILLYQGNVKGNFIILAASIILSAVICILSSGLYMNTEEPAVKNIIRRETDEYVKTFVQTGMSGLFNRYQGTGGLSSGRLGGVNSVRPDFETDLVVTYVPDSVNTVYLKSFSGSFYAMNQWSENAVILRTDDTQQLSYYQILLKQHEINELEKQVIDRSKTRAKMRVKNVDAYGLSHYVPYLTIDSFEEEQPFPTGTEDILTYYPLQYFDYPVKEDILLKNPEYNRYVNECCLSVPDFLLETLTDYCLEKNYPGILTGGINLQAYDEYKDVNEYRLAVANAIHADFVQNYPYTMSPGATPPSEDFVEYFLTEQKRGYCAHFASSAVMLLRTMGIPARYVEGYCIPPSLLAEDGVILEDELYSDWFEGTSYFPIDSVVEVEVNDSYAHAWVEIYLEGYGFIPYEMTPPSFETESQNFADFSNILARLFGRPLELEDFSDTTPTNPFESNQNNTFFNRFHSIPSQNLLKPVLYIMLVIIVLLMIYLLVRKILEEKRYRKLLSEKQYKKLTYDLYIRILRALNRYIKGLNPNALPLECKDILSGHLKNAGIPDEDRYDSYFIRLEEIMYRRADVTAEEYDQIKAETEEILKVIKNPSRIRS